MPKYSIKELDDLEEQAESSKPIHQIPALALVSSLLERYKISYGVMGGMNFFLRGSQRATGDVDIAVDNPPRMDELLSIFNSHPDIYRPANVMQWASGVARLFVRIKSRYLVQVDLKPRGSEGNLVPTNLAKSVETIQLPSIRCQGLSIGPLVAAKIKAHYDRETDDDYHDLRFVCTSTTYASMVRQAAPTFRKEWKECFLEKVLDRQPSLQEQVRWALRMERNISPESKRQLEGKKSDVMGGRGDIRGGRNGSAKPSNDRSPKDDNRSNSRHGPINLEKKSSDHRDSYGRVSWSNQSRDASSASKAPTASRSAVNRRDADQSKDRSRTNNTKRE